MHEKGHTLLETMVVLLVLGALLAFAPPLLEAYRRESHVLGAARVFKGQFLRARSIATMKNAQAAIRFERRPDGSTWYATWVDGDSDGVRADDIRRGTDFLAEGPVRLDVPAQRVEVAVLPGVTEIPPGRGTLDTSDAIRFAHDTISFSPLGTATPGTFYLAGQGVMAGVRVSPGSARVRLMFWRGHWEERP